MPIIVTVNTTAECPRTDCNIHWEEKKSLSIAAVTGALLYTKPASAGTV